MFKTSQEVISQKNSVDKEVSKTKTTKLDAERNVKTTIKYLSTTLSANPNPSHNILATDINAESLNETLGGGLSVALVKAIGDGEEKSEVMVTEK